MMGTFPMVFLKNTSSIVEGLTERSAGRRSRSLPKRQGWVGYLKRRSGGQSARDPKRLRIKNVNINVNQGVHVMAGA